MAKPDSPSAAATEIGDLCSLSPDALRERLALIRREILPHARDPEALENGLSWAFAAPMRSRLEQLVELERRCCNGLEWRLESRGAGLRLVVEGADPGRLSALLRG